MKSLIRLTDLKPSEIYDIFRISDEIQCGKYAGAASLFKVFGQGFGFLAQHVIGFNYTDPLGKTFFDV